MNFKFYYMYPNSSRDYSCYTYIYTMCPPSYKLVNEPFNYSYK